MRKNTGCQRSLLAALVVLPLLALLVDDCRRTEGGKTASRCCFTAAASTTAATGSVSEDLGIASTTFASLMQLSEAVLAPVWSSGGFAYALDGLPTNPQQQHSRRQVCLHTRVSSTLAAAPFTFSMFDAQLSVLYLATTTTTTAESSTIAAPTAAHAIGRLNVQSGCYAQLNASAAAAAATETTACMADLFSGPAQCVPGKTEDALTRNWTAELLALPLSAAASTAQLTSLSANGLRASELFPLFLNDYLPQRSWLRSVVPRSLDVLASAARSAEVFRSSTAALRDADEIAAMQDAVVSEWNGYLWNTYGPQLRRKWSLLHRMAVATLVKGGVAPSSREDATVDRDSITGASAGSTASTACPLVDAWVQFQHAPHELTVARFAAFMGDALSELRQALVTVRNGNGSIRGDDATRSDAVVLRLLRAAFCVTTTNLFSLIALLDRPFLQAVSSVWLDVANHSDSWAWQTMRSAAAAVPPPAIRDALSFQSSTAEQLKALTSTARFTDDQVFLQCLATFLDPSTPLASDTVASPSDCVGQLLKTAASEVGESLTTVWDVHTLSRVPSTGGLPGIARFESSVSFPSEDATGPISVPVRWLLVQEAALGLSAQTSVFHPSVHLSPGKADTCSDSSSSARRGNGDWFYECPRGTYVQLDSITCATCPSACAAAVAAPPPLSSSPPRDAAAFPVYCKGDGLLHGCPYRSPGAAFAGSSDGGLSTPFAACRYTCGDLYAAPLNFSCLSVAGFFYNTSATGNRDVFNGGGLSPCAAPTDFADVFPASFPISSQRDAYSFVGSGATDTPLSCPFTLRHRVTSTAISPETLRAMGILPPAPFFASTVMTTDAAPLRVHSGTTWEAEVQLNATQMYAMHRAAAAGVVSTSDRTPLLTTIAHELFAVQHVSDSSSSDTTEDGEATAARVLSWYLVSTYNHSAESSDSDSSRSAAPSGADVKLQLLLNTSMQQPASSAATVAGVYSASTTTSTSTNDEGGLSPASLIVLSSPWQWLLSASTSPITTATYRVVFSAATNTITFYVNDALLGSSTTPDWPQWATPMPSSEAAYKRMGSCFLSLSGWVAGYTDAEQWRLVDTTNPSLTNAGAPTRLPLHFDFFPGIVARLSTAATVFDDLQSLFADAEAAWKAQAAANAAAEARQVLQLTSLHDLACYVAPSSLVAATVSATLTALALRTSKGLDGVCRPGFGVLPTSTSTSQCDTCVAGSYTVLNASAGSNSCACTPQRLSIISLAPPAFIRPVSVCQERVAGPAVPQSSLQPKAALSVDEDVINRENASMASIPLGWYAAASLTTTVSCLYGLTYPAIGKGQSASSALLNSTVSLRYTTGLGDEACFTRAASRTALSRPTYTPWHGYKLRFQAPALAAVSLSIGNGSQLAADQTVLAVGVHSYAFLSPYATHAILQMAQLTEYQLAWLAYILRTVTVSAALDCSGGSGAAQQKRNLTWAAASALDTTVLKLDLTEADTGNCSLSFTVTRATAAAAGGSSVPFATWPHSHLTVPASTSTASFFEESSTLMLAVQAPLLEAATTPWSSVLGELSSLLMAMVLLSWSLFLCCAHAATPHAPTLHPLAWRPYARKLAEARHHEGAC